MKKILSSLLMFSLVQGVYAQSEVPEKVITFGFTPEQDVFYIPKSGNDAELNRLYSLVDECRVERVEIIAGQMPVYVDAYCDSQPTTKENLNTAKPFKPYCLAIRTNLLHDVFLLPNLGVEWYINPAISIKVDGSRSWWGGKHGRVQKIWLVNPEVRWYMCNTKRFYAGVSANFGEYNVYRGMIGRLKSGKTGYQGKLWEVGLTEGYQLNLSRSFLLDFNIGLGYARFKYDSFNMTDGKRIYKEKDKRKNYFGLTQAGISLVWMISGNK